VKIGIFTDLHLDAVTGGLPRFDDIRDAVTDVVEQCIAQKVDVAVCCGDVCNPDAGSVVVRAIHCMQLVAKTLHDARIPFFCIAGNHDVIEDGRGRSVVTPLSVIDGCTVIEGIPKLYTVGNVDLMFLPYAPRAMRYDPDAEVRRKFPDGKVARETVAFGHMNIDGARIGSEVRHFARGADMQYPVAALKEVGVRIMVNGHLHTRQVVNDVVCPGSLERLRFDEKDNTPGWMMVEVS
jgi:DNA repair exonuclease SbcCD nuclease subunit